jgi:RNA polymerase sigma-70 factor (ECF subfamily)
MTNKTSDSIPTRQSLLRRLKDLDDQASWHDFFDTYRRLIHNVAVRAGLSETEAQEVVQETVIAVSRNIGEFRVDPARGSFRAWLMKQTHWRIADQFRNRGKALPRFPTSPTKSVPSRISDDTRSTATMDRIPDPAGALSERVWEEEWARNRAAVALERVRQKVSTRQYQVFDLNVLQNLPARETARIMDASVASVYVAKHRISRLLKKEIGKLEREADLNGSRQH